MMKCYLFLFVITIVILIILMIDYSIYYDNDFLIFLTIHKQKMTIMKTATKYKTNVEYYFNDVVHKIIINSMNITHTNHCVVDQLQSLLLLLCNVTCHTS